MTKILGLRPIAIDNASPPARDVEYHPRNPTPAHQPTRPRPPQLARTGQSSAARRRAQLESTAFLVMSLGEATMRLAIAVGRREGDRLVEGYKRMVLRELAPERPKARRKAARRS